MTRDAKNKTGDDSANGGNVGNIGALRSEYLPTIGLEIHAELATASKMFCSCKNDPDEPKPNVNICPICLGHPGTLPVLNHEAIRQVLRIGTALNGSLADFTEWDRKQYFYPDIPKGYQISQYAYPLVSGGELSGVALERIHLEEDTAQSTHDAHAKSLVNFNRSGVPLMELVTKPVIHDAKTAVGFARELQSLLRYLGAGEANMEKGEMRVEANISVAKVTTAAITATTATITTSARTASNISPSSAASTVAGETSVERGEAECETLRLSEEGEAGSSAIRTTATKNATLGTKTEVKNLNSFRVVEKAIEFEIDRQISLLERGEKVIQETRGWDDKKGVTFSQRSKESAHDYRYFPDPDIPKMKISEIAEFSHKTLSDSLPELPWNKRARFKRDYGATDKEAEVFVENVRLADYFDRIAKAGSELKLKENKKDFNRLAMNYLLTDYLGALKTSKIDFNNTKQTISPENWAQLIGMIIEGKLSSRGAKDTLTVMIKEPNQSPQEIAEKAGLLQKNDPEALEKVVRKVIEANKSVINEFKAGKTASLQYLIGQVMRETKGSANPASVKEVLEKNIR